MPLGAAEPVARSTYFDLMHTPNVSSILRCRLTREAIISDFELGGGLYSIEQGYTNHQASLRQMRFS